MRMIVIPRLGGPEVLTMIEVEQPTPRPDEVLIKLRFAGLTYGDIYQREGTYRKGALLKESEAPLRIGGEGAGTVAMVGANVTHLKEGDDVVYCECLGSYAEYAAVPAWRVVKIPTGIRFQDAAAVFSLGGTAHYLAHDTGKLRPGLSCLIHAGAGGLGHLLIQFAKMLGASVLTTVGNEAKARFRHHMRTRDEISRRAEGILSAMRDGRLRVAVCRTFPLSKPVRLTVSSSRGRRLARFFCRSLERSRRFGFQQRSEAAGFLRQNQFNPP